MSRYIPVEPEKWGEMVKALSEVKRLQTEVERLSAADSYLQNANEYAYEKRCDELEAEVESLRKELADAQENYHIVNEMVAKMLKEGKQS